MDEFLNNQEREILLSLRNRLIRQAVKLQQRIQTVSGLLYGFDPGAGETLQEDAARPKDIHILAVNDSAWDTASKDANDKPETGETPQEGPARPDRLRLLVLDDSALSWDTASKDANDKPETGESPEAPADEDKTATGAWHPLPTKDQAGDEPQPAKRLRRARIKRRLRTKPKAEPKRITDRVVAILADGMPWSAGDIIRRYREKYGKSPSHLYAVLGRLHEQGAVTREGSRGGYIYRLAKGDQK